MTPTDYIAIGAVFLSLLTLIVGYMRQPPLVSAHRISSLESAVREYQDIADRRAEEVKAMEERIGALERRVRDLLQEREFWQDEYRKLRLGLSGSSS
jgi:FtsZ-binding cell division protein ZapB